MRGPTRAARLPRKGIAAPATEPTSGSSSASPTPAEAAPSYASTGTLGLFPPTTPEPAQLNRREVSHSNGEPSTCHAISNLMALGFQILTPRFRWRKSEPHTHTNIPISLRQQSPGRRRSETSCGICSPEPSKSWVHLLFSPVSAFKSFAFEISLLPRPAGNWGHWYSFVELGMWQARICFQSRISGWAG